MERVTDLDDWRSPAVVSRKREEGLLRSSMLQTCHQEVFAEENAITGGKEDGRTGEVIRG
jgi:hypothetical protein